MPKIEWPPAAKPGKIKARLFICCLMILLCGLIHVAPCKQPSMSRCGGGMAHLHRHLGGAQGGGSLLAPYYSNCAGAPEFCGHVPKFGDEYMDATKCPRADLLAEDSADASAAARTVLCEHPLLSAPRALAPCGPVGWPGPSYVAVPKANLYKMREACALI
ncbi:MAG: hypothetical protein J3K34DRAFT_447814 [Monoraphidium minutum]|nr:MAG: hypothetical protein J3K34DRAFT_447814 [Monoraphidium minutum]